MVEPIPQPAARDARRSNRAVVTGAAVLGVALILGVTGFVITRNAGAETTAAAKTLPVETTTITRTDLATTLSLEGKLGYGGEKAIKGGSDGEVTWLPKPGSTITRGEQVFRVDDQPVRLFYGTTPLFRPLDTIGMVGRDVKVVASNLRALGYSIGDQPAVGSRITQRQQEAQAPAQEPVPSEAPSPSGESAKPADPPAESGQPRTLQVRSGDAVLTSSLRAAIKRWQGDTGAAETGVLSSGAVVVQPGRIRVESATAQLGDPADSALISVTRMAKVVTVSVQADEMDAVRSTRTVTITLPDGTTTPGRVGRISRVVATAEDGGGGGPDDQPRSTATVTFVRPRAVRDLDSAPVQVQFVAEARKDVLAVPVGALLALSEGGYAVQPQAGGLIPVETGLFAKGMVEISGDGVAEGTTVVTTS